MPSRSIVGCHLTARSIYRHCPSSSRSFVRVAPLHEASSHLPRIARPSFWQSLVPRFLRKGSHDEDVAITTASPRHIDRRTKRTGASIAALSILVGSFAINVIALRRELVTFSRKTEAKLGLLREVLDRVKAGEEVDVKKLLGTGDPEQEKEWEELVQEIEEYNRSAGQASKSSEQGIASKVRHAWTSWFQSDARDHVRDHVPQENAVSNPRDDDKSQSTQPRFLM